MKVKDKLLARCGPCKMICVGREQIMNSELSVSLKGTMGLPSSEALKAVEGYTLLRTDRNGCIELCTDGIQMWVEAAR